MKGVGQYPLRFFFDDKDRSVNLLFPSLLFIYGPILILYIYYDMIHLVDKG